MAYQTYITEALVCGVYDVKSADRSYLLFTREAGMLYAHAKSVREERSKHRYALQACSHIRVTLVRGKTGWKITGTEPIANVYAAMESREARAFLRTSVRLLRRIVQGETTHIELFDDVLYALSRVQYYNPMTLEYVLSLRMLHMLGYIAPKPVYAMLLHTSSDEAFTASLEEGTIKEMKSAIEHALQQSQL